jgi:peptide/nickel transport system permease protein
MLPRLALRYLALLAAAVLLNFALPRALPGDPLGADAADGMAGAASLPAAARAQLRATYHLDLPPAAQLAAYLRDLTRLDFGWSISRNAPVAGLLAERLPWTLGLVLTASLTAATLGAAAGGWAAWRGGRAGGAVLSASAALAALPEFLLAMALLLAFGVALRWLPIQGARVPFASFPAGPAGLLARATDLAAHLALPAATLVIAIRRVRPRQGALRARRRV